MSEPDWTAQIDQMIAGLRDLATLIGSYYSELLKQGFSNADALQIVLAWQANFQAHASSGSEETED